MVVSIVNFQIFLGIQSDDCLRNNLTISENARAVDIINEKKGKLKLLLFYLKGRSAIDPK